MKKIIKIGKYNTFCMTKTFFYEYLYIPYLFFYINLFIYILINKIKIFQKYV